MKSSQTARGHCRKSRPTVAAARTAIADEVIRESIALYHQAQRAQARYHEGSAGDDALAAVGDVLCDRIIDAEKNLIRAILAAFEGPYRCRPEQNLYPSRGVRVDGRLYLVTPDDSDAEVFELEIGDAHPEGVDIMHLHVVDESLISDVGTVADRPAYEPDWSGVERVDDPDAASK